MTPGPRRDHLRTINPAERITLVADQKNDGAETHRRPFDALRESKGTNRLPETIAGVRLAVGHSQSFRPSKAGAPDEPTRSRHSSVFGPGLDKIKKLRGQSRYCTDHADHTWCASDGFCTRSVGNARTRRSQSGESNNEFEVH